MKPVKKASITLIALMMVAGVSATAFGTFPYSQSKETSGEIVTYNVGLVNLGGQPLQIEASASGAEEVTVNLPEDTVIQPSRVSEDPGDEGRWFFLGNGSYAKVKVYSFEAAARDFRNESFDVTFRAFRKGDSGEGGFQNIIQARTYNFELVNSSYSKGLIDFSKDETDEEETGSKGENVTIDDANDSKSDEAPEEQPETEESSGFSWVLGLGALVSLAYLGKVIMF